MNCALSILKPMLCVGSLSIDILTLCADIPQPSKDNDNEDDQHYCLDAQWLRGGHCSNVSMVLRMLGAQVEFFGVLSNSSLLSSIIKEMEQNQIDFKHCPRTTEEPPFSTILVTKKGDKCSVIECNHHFPYVTVEDFKKIDLSRYGWVHFEARNFKETIKIIRFILDYNNKREQRINISIKVDTDYKQSIDLFDMCDYVIFSRHLAGQLGWRTAEETCLELDRAIPLPHSLHIRRPAFICSWGKLGAGCISTEGHYEELPAQKVFPVVETRGAGKCFTAAFIYAVYIREMNINDAVRFANRVAGHKTSGIGLKTIESFNIYPVDKPQIEEALSGDITEEDEVNMRICSKYLNRKIEYNDGKLATDLLNKNVFISTDQVVERSATTSIFENESQIMKPLKASLRSSFRSHGSPRSIQIQFTKYK